jgi:hypothetical protein
MQNHRYNFSDICGNFFAFLDGSSKLPDTPSFCTILILICYCCSQIYFVIFTSLQRFISYCISGIILKWNGKIVFRNWWCMWKYSKYIWKHISFFSMPSFLIAVVKLNFANKCHWSYLSFIPLPCAEYDNSLSFSGAPSIPICYLLFPATLHHQLFFHPP